MLRFISFKRKNNPIAPEIPIFLLGGFLLALFVYAFFATPINSSIEKIIWDFKTVLRSKINLKGISNSNQVVIVPLRQEDNTHVVEKELTLKVEPSVNLLKDIFAEKPSQVVFFLYPSILDPMSKILSPLLELSQTYPNLYFGTLDINKETPSNLAIDRILPQNGRFLGLDTHRKREQSLREMPLYSYLGLEQALHMTSFVSLKHLGIEPKKSNLSQLGFSEKEIIQKTFFLNYKDINNQKLISPSDIINKKTEGALKGKIVLIAPNYFKNRVTDEHFFVQTPYQSKEELAERGQGVSLVNIESLTIQNLLNQNYLKEPEWKNIISIVQVLFVLSIAFITWQLSLTTAIISICISWMLIFAIHIIVIESYNLILPTTNAAFFSFLSAFVGGIWRMIYDSKMRISKEIKTSGSAKISSARSLFLRKFSQTLSSFNKNVIKQLLEKEVQNDRFKVIHKSLYESSKEFEVYLDTIEQFASLTENDTRFLNKSTVNVFNLLSSVLSKFSVSLNKTNISFEIYCSNKMKMNTDPTFLEPILFNLFSNAIKYSPSNSKIEVLVKKNLAGKTSFYIKDQGSGIPEQYLEKIFEKFFRITGDTSVNVKGTGLGLFLCKFFTLRLKGSLKVKSQVGKGSTFILTV